AQEQVAAERAVGTERQQRGRPARRAGIRRRTRVRRRGDVRPWPDRLPGVEVEAAGELVVRAVPEPPGEDGRQRERRDEQKDDEPEAGDGDAVAAEPDPDELPIATSLDLRLADDVGSDDPFAVAYSDVDLVDRAHETWGSIFWEGRIARRNTQVETGSTA